MRAGLVDDVGRTMRPEEFCELQEKQGWTNQQTADRLGVSPSSVTKWRGGQHDIPVPVQIAMRAICGVSVQE